ncbi:MAG TPA: hypothetical protein VJ773_05070 [Gemmatimonadales bacterium]|nr:hypothetical protein [Gemmatimonadales bacterium]
MTLEVRVVSADPGPLPVVRWTWEPETDILAGAFPVPHTTGFTGPVELTDDEGSIVVVDVAGGVVCGLDVAVWPEVETVPGLSAPGGAPAGQALVPSRPARTPVGAVEVDTTLSMAVSPDGRTYHLRIGTRRAVEVVRIADHLAVEVDRRHRLAGFWATEVPRRPDLDLT